MQEVRKSYNKRKLTDKQVRVFAREYARTGNNVMSVQKALPERNLKPYSASTYGSDLLKHVDIQKEIEYQRKKLAILATKASDRLEQLIDSENEMIATKNVHFAIEQSKGKAVQEINQTVKAVNINIDLTKMQDDVL